MEIDPFKYTPFMDFIVEIWGQEASVGYNSIKYDKTISEVACLYKGGLILESFSPWLKSPKKGVKSRS